MASGAHSNQEAPLLFPLLELPCGPLALVYAHLDAAARQALMQTSKAARARPCLSSEATFVSRCTAETAYFSRKRSSLVSPGGSSSSSSAAAALAAAAAAAVSSQQQHAGLLQGAPLGPGVHKARMVHDLARLPRTSIERFFKHSASRHLLATCRAALKDAPTRSFMAGVTHLTLQAWDLDDQEAPAIAQLLHRLFPRLRHMDASTCVAGETLLLALQRELCCGGGSSASPSAAGVGAPSPAARRAHGGGSGGGAAQATLTVVLPPSGNGGDVERWRAACPSLRLLTSAPSTFTAKAGQGSPPNWAVSPARSRPAEGAAAMRISGGGGGAPVAAAAAGVAAQPQMRRYGIMH